MPAGFWYGVERVRLDDEARNNRSPFGSAADRHETKVRRAGCRHMLFARSGEMSTSRFKMAAIAAVALGASAMTISAPAYARGNGGAIAAGVVGGLALGAIAGSAAANAAPAYGYGYAAPAYAAPAPVYDGGCYFTRQATYDPYGNFAGYRRVRVCE
jgi:hypothetical protein